MNGNVSFINSNWSRFVEDLIQNELVSLSNYSHGFDIDPIELSLRFEIERTVFPSFHFNSSFIPSSVVIFEIENTLPFSIFYNNSSTSSTNTGITTNEIENNSTKILITEQTECHICLDTLLEGSCMRRLNICSHKFCIDCIDLWLNRCGSCPLCKSPVSSSI